MCVYPHIRLSVMTGSEAKEGKQASASVSSRGCRQIVFLCALSLVSYSPAITFFFLHNLSTDSKMHSHFLLDLVGSPPRFSPRSTILFHHSFYQSPRSSFYLAERLVELSCIDRDSCQRMSRKILLPSVAAVDMSKFTPGLIQTPVVYLWVRWIGKGPESGVL